MQDFNRHHVSKSYIYELVRAYWLIVTIVFVAGTLTMWAALPVVFTDIYESKVKLLVKIGRENAETPTTVQRGQVLSQGVRLADINSEIEILSSTSLFEKVIDRVGLEAFRSELAAPETFWDYPKYYLKKTGREGKRLWNEFLILASLKKRMTEREAVLLDLVKGVTVEPVRDSDILVLKVATPAARLSVDIANVLVEEYLRERMNIRRSSAGSDFFLGQMNEARQRLAEATSRRASVREQWKLSSPSEERTQSLNQLDKIEEEMVDNETEIAGLRRQLDLMTARKNALPESVPKERMEERNPSLASINERITALLVEQAKTATRYNPASETMRKIDSEIQELEAARSREASTVVGTVTSETNPTRRYFDTETETTLVHIEGLIRRNEALSRPAEELRRRIREVSTGFDAYESAEREYKTAEQIYLSYGQRLQEAQMSEELDARRVANVVAIGQPERPTLPSAPNRIFLMEIAMAAALVLGIGLAALLETTEDRILGERSVLDMDNVAYLGTVKISRTA